MSLRAFARPAAGDSEGALVLLHGRGADETQLAGLFDVLDPERRLLGLAPRAPYEQGRGSRWYSVNEPGAPEREAFLFSCGLAAEWLDGLGFAPERTVLGGFSQGAAISYALALGAGSLISVTSNGEKSGGDSSDMPAPSVFSFFLLILSLRV